MTEIYGFMSVAQLLFPPGRAFFRKRTGRSFRFCTDVTGVERRPGPMFIFATAGLWYFFIYLKGHKKINYSWDYRPFAMASFCHH